MLRLLLVVVICLAVQQKRWFLCRHTNTPFRAMRVKFSSGKTHFGCSITETQWHRRNRQMAVRENMSSIILSLSDSVRELLFVFCFFFFSVFCFCRK